MVLFPGEIMQQKCIGLSILALNKSFVSGIFGIVSHLPQCFCPQDGENSYQFWRFRLIYDCHFVFEITTFYHTCKNKRKYTNQKIQSSWKQVHLKARNSNSRRIWFLIPFLKLLPPLSTQTCWYAGLTISSKGITSF